MGVTVLPSQDSLRNHSHRHEIVFPATKPRRSPISNHNANSNRSNRRGRNSPPPSAGSQTRPESPPVMGHVQILQRGEDLSPLRRPEFNRKAEGFFAGSTVTSPSPSSVPLPVFFTARRNCGHNQMIESELKRVLRLI